MKKILTLFITSLFIIVIYSGCSVKEEQTTVSEDKTTNSMSGESTISVPASDNDLYNENCLTGIMVGRSSTHKCIWVTLEEDIEGIEKGQDVIIHITDKLEKQVMDYELGARLSVYYDNIPITDEPQITAPHKIVLSE